ncbi:MAG: 3-keto-disaccharide hydrolase [Akkermansiaceae bacterium]
MLKTLLFTSLTFSTALAADKSDKASWTDPDKAVKEDPDFSIQGEYFKEGASHGVQVVALGNGKFDAYLLEGGLPGKGWTKGKARIKISGARDGDVIKFTSNDQHGITISKNTLTLAGKVKAVLPKIERQSPTLGAKPPQGAKVLFDGSSAEGWKNGKMENGLLLATGTTSKDTFRDYTLHLEFRTPYKPHARGQGRGNSGVYFGGRWETQVLDSFGLDGKMNECGGIYSVAEPKVNMCLPPLTWQTYDVEFTDAKFDADGKRTAWPRMTVKLNGVVIHDDQELAKDGTTAAPAKGPLKPEGRPVFLQNHGNPVVFRNIWVKPKE